MHFSSAFHCSWSVGLSVCPHVSSRTVAAVDGYVDMCNGRSAQQESGAASSKNSRGPKIIYSYYTRCAFIPLSLFFTE